MGTRVCYDFGRLRPRLVLLLAIFFLLGVIWHTRDLTYVSRVPWPIFGQGHDSGVEEELAVDRPQICRIQYETGGGNTTYTCLGRRPEKLPPPNPPGGGRPVHIPMPAHCIDAHFAKGEPCSSMPNTPPKLDVVWIWANGSDPLFRYAITDALDLLPPSGAKAKVSLKSGAKLYRSVHRSESYGSYRTLLTRCPYRDHDELRYSLRSVLQHFSSHAGKFHLLTTDVGDGDGYRYGILPQWLDTNTTLPWTDGDVQLNVVHHSQVFEHLDNSTFNRYGLF
jgi:hypothetical protein